MLLVRLAHGLHSYNVNIGTSAPLSDRGFEKVSATGSTMAMKVYIQRVLDSEDLMVANRDLPMLDDFAELAAHSSEFESLPDLKAILVSQHWVVMKVKQAASIFSKSLNGARNKFSAMMGRGTVAGASTATRSEGRLKHGNTANVRGKARGKAAKVHVKATRAHGKVKVHPHATAKVRAHVPVAKVHRDVVPKQPKHKAVEAAKKDEMKRDAVGDASKEDAKPQLERSAAKKSLPAAVVPVALAPQNEPQSTGNDIMDAKEGAKEDAKEDVKEIAKESQNSTAKEDANKEDAKEDAKDLQNSAAKEDAREDAKETAEELQNSAAKDDVKDVQDQKQLAGASAGVTAASTNSAASDVGEDVSKVATAPEEKAKNVSDDAAPAIKEQMGDTPENAANQGPAITDAGGDKMTAAVAPAGPDASMPQDAQKMSAESKDTESKDAPAPTPWWRKMCAQGLAVLTFLTVAYVAFE